MPRWLVAPVDWDRLRHPEHARWLEMLTVVVPIGVAVVVAMSRDDLAPPTAGLVWVGAAMMPFALAHLGLPLTPPVFAALVAGGALPLLADPVTDADLVPFVLVLAAIYGALAAPGLLGLSAAAVGIATMTGVQVIGWWTDGAVVWSIGILFGWAGGAGPRMLLEVLHDLKAAQATLAATAARDERRRIAREIHDVVAHTLTVTMLHMTGARMTLRHDPDDAEAALLEAERLGRASLSEIRRTVGLLADERPAPPITPPAPTLADVPGLVAAHRGAGHDVTLTVAGDPDAHDAVPTATALGVYRIAQEALTNAAKHAPGAQVEVQLDIDDTITLVIQNEPRQDDPRDAEGQRDLPPGGGLGLAGMRERAAVLDGDLTVGPTPAGGWRVALRAPVAVVGSR